ncbi:hypothetical protein G9C85_13745 [Halorubellus sp. JP-L1]|uniref:BsuPI-related putative proteinase inhibitor n=1 Tax=Halorubellus sp. JP-L1 TaxID=2715753 RepID=UPI00140DD51D|nr:BsuPI-related putative proteinase inhibitor [Halorubellus sp. JP-L1]NHN42685.1 hypothetical protein [Halorubellus sp. JP-L1]
MTLSGSLSATVSDDAVEFEYAVANDGSEAVDLQFSDSQTHEVVVFEDGEEVWSFSDDRMFMQMLQSESIAPGDAVTYAATWEDAPAGEYEARAWLTANDVDCEAATSFTV